MPPPDGAGESGIKIQSSTFLPMFKRVSRAVLARAAQTKRMQKKRERVAQSKMEMLSDKELIKAIDQKDFHRAMKEGDRASRRRRENQAERVKRIARNYLPKSDS